MPPAIKRTIIATGAIALLSVGAWAAYRMGGTGLGANVSGLKNRTPKDLKPWPAELDLKPWPPEAELKAWPAEAEVKTAPAAADQRPAAGSQK